MENQGYYNLHFMQVLYKGSTKGTKGSETKPEQKYHKSKCKKYYLLLYGRNLPVIGKEISEAEK